MLYLKARWALHHNWSQNSDVLSLGTNLLNSQAVAIKFVRHSDLSITVSKSHRLDNIGAS